MKKNMKKWIGAVAATTMAVATVSGSMLPGAVINAEETAAEAENYAVLSTDNMDAYVAKDFPSVVRYEMKGELEGKTFYGQTQPIHTIRINGVDVELTAEDVKATFENNRAEYVMTVKGEGIDAVITAELVADANTMAFNIIKIENNLEDSVDGNPIQTVEIPNHNLVSVNTD